MTSSNKTKPYNNYTGGGTNPTYDGQSPSADI
nr:MAG TPA: hypothetical protein [Bacteriophage sp.]DAT29109.1 MAG TPA: hypothetical protein [Caudoviricetes sp.]